MARTLRPRWSLWPALLAAAACAGTTAAPAGDGGTTAADATTPLDAGRSAADAEPATDVPDGPTDDAAASPPDAGTSTPPTRRALRLTTTDGLGLAATLVTSSVSPAGAPGLVLVHQFGLSQAQWGQLPERLALRGYRVLLLDLRGHGGSDPYGGPRLDALLTDPAGAPRDVAAALAYLGVEGEADPARLGVVGTSVGANLAVVAALTQGVATAVALSARIPPTEALAARPARGMRGVYYLAGELDPGGQAADGRALHTATAEPRGLTILPGSRAHGVELLSQHPEVEGLVTDWLAAHLR
jgi:pimeloyl-ACP methyl ester carboxylesterase